MLMLKDTLLQYIDLYTRHKTRLRVESTTLGSQVYAIGVSYNRFLPSHREIINTQMLAAHVYLPEHNIYCQQTTQAH